MSKDDMMFKNKVNEELVEKNYRDEEREGF